MDFHPHVGFDLDCILEGAPRHRNRFECRYGRGSLRIDFFIHTVSIHIGTKVEALLVELLNRRGDFHGEPDNLVRDELFLQRCAGL